MNKPVFLITIDTEPDNQWEMTSYDSMENIHYLPRFQNLCEKYGFKPVYLTEYNVANDAYYINYIENKLANDLCEIGIHLHAWSTPPLYKVTDNDTLRKPYLLDYPPTIMMDKFESLYNLLYRRFGKNATCIHRAGRWAFNETYLSILKSFSIMCDCSIVPNTIISSSSAYFSEKLNYSSVKNRPYQIDEKNVRNSGYSGVYEIPFTSICYPELPSILELHIPKKIRKRISPIQQLRPNGKNLRNMLWILRYALAHKLEHVEFMLHSSEIMPGCNPTFRTQQDIEALYNDIEAVFATACEKFENIKMSSFVQSLFLKDSTQ